VRGTIAKLDNKYIGNACFWKLTTGTDWFKKTIAEKKKVEIKMEQFQVQFRCFHI
jgi:hypothetical protein